MTGKCSCPNVDSAGELLSELYFLSVPAVRVLMAYLGVTSYLVFVLPSTYWQNPVKYLIYFKVTNQVIKAAVSDIKGVS